MCMNDVYILQKPGSGLSSLVRHVKAKHLDHRTVCKVACESTGPIENHFSPSVSREATNIFYWAEQCVMRMEPFNFVEDPYVVKNSKLIPICTETLVKYLERLGKAVERKLRMIIPDRFGLVFDGWSMGSEHYIAIFLLLSVGDVIHVRLMCCGVQDEIEGEDEETAFTAEDIGDYLFDELDLLGRTDVRDRVKAATAINASTTDIDNNPIEFITGDNTATNPRLAYLLGTKFKGCDAHKLNLEVNEFIGPKPKRAREDEPEQGERLTKRRKLIMKTDKLMVALRTLKNAAQLRRVNKHKAKRINGVRWSAQLGTMIREHDLREDLPVGNFSRETKELFLSAVEQTDADELVTDLKIFEKVSKALQGQGKKKDSPLLTVAQSRELLDKLIDRFPDHQFMKITKDSPLVTHKLWESAIVKIQNNQEDRLNADEKREVRIYLLPDAPPEEDEEYDEDDFNISDILSHQEKSAEAR